MLCLGVGESVVRIPAIVTCAAAPRHGFCSWLQWEFPRSKEVPLGEGAKMTYVYLSSCKAPRTCVYNPNCGLRGNIREKAYTQFFWYLLPPKQRTRWFVSCHWDPNILH